LAGALGGDVPSARWRRLYDRLKERHSSGRAEREYLGILALGLQERLESLEAVIEELGAQVSLDTIRRHFCPPNNIVEMKLEVNLSVYDELLGPDRIHSTDTIRPDVQVGAAALGSQAANGTGVSD